MFRQRRSSTGARIACRGSMMRFATAASLPIIRRAAREVVEFADRFTAWAADRFRGQFRGRLAARIAGRRRGREVTGAAARGAGSS